MLVIHDANRAPGQIQLVEVHSIYLSATQTCAKS
jgi:hypothetical protein